MQSLEIRKENSLHRKHTKSQLFKALSAQLWHWHDLLWWPDVAQQHTSSLPHKTQAVLWVSRISQSQMWPKGNCKCKATFGPNGDCCVGGLALIMRSDLTPSVVACMHYLACNLFVRGAGWVRSNFLKVQRVWSFLGSASVLIVTTRKLRFNLPKSAIM